MKVRSTQALTTNVPFVRALRYPTYERLILGRMLVPTFGSIMVGVGNLCSLGVDALHASGSLSVMSVTVITHVVIVPISLKKGSF
jgi:hypothetical protein